MASLMYAYEDIFGAAGSAADQPAAGIGPAGTAVVGQQARQPPARGGGNRKPVIDRARRAVLLRRDCHIALSLSYKPRSANRESMAQQLRLRTPRCEMTRGGRPKCFRSAR